MRPGGTPEGRMEGLSEGHEGSETFAADALVSCVVWRVLMEHCGDGDGVGEQFGEMPPGAIGVDGREAAGVEKDVPVGHADGFLVGLLAGHVIEFRQGASRSEVVFVFVDLLQSRPVAGMMAAVRLVFLGIMMCGPAGLDTFKLHRGIQEGRPRELLDAI